MNVWTNDRRQKQDPIFADHLNRILDNVARFPRVEAAVTTVTSASETLVKFQRFLAGSTEPGRLIIVRAAGYYTTTGSETWTLRFRRSGTTWHTLVTAAGAGSNQPWCADWIVDIKNRVHASLLYAGSLAHGRAGATNFVRNAFEQDWDPTANQDLELTAQASSGSGQSLSCSMFVTETHAYL